MIKNILIGLVVLVCGLLLGYFIGPKIVPYEYQEVQEYAVYQSRIDSLNMEIAKLSLLWDEMKDPMEKYRTQVKYIRELRPINDPDSLLNSVNTFLKNE